MQRIATWRRQFNWRMLLMRTLINALALLVTAALVPDIFFVDKTVRTWLLLALSLGILNTVIKPLIQVATLRYIFATYGVVVALINAIILFLLSLLFPARFAVHGIIWALVGGAVIGIVSSLLENLLGLTPPIVSEKYPEIRQRIKDRESRTLETHIAQAATEKMLTTEEVEAPVTDPVDDAAAVLAVVGAGDDATATEPQDEEPMETQSALQEGEVSPSDQPKPM